MATIIDAEGQMNAHSGESRRSAKKHLREALDALKHGEDDNACAHILDAMISLGRMKTFAELADWLLQDALTDEGA